MTIRPMFGRLFRGEEVRQRYRITVELGGKIEDVLDRAYWVHVSRALRTGDIIEARAEDNAWYAEILVLDVINTAIGVAIPTMALLFHVDLNDADKSQATETYHAEFKGAAKFVIIRDSDKAMIERDIPTKERAEARVKELMAA